MLKRLTVVLVLLLSMQGLIQPAFARAVQLAYYNEALLFNACEKAGGVYFDPPDSGGEFKCITQCRDSNGNWSSCSVTCSNVTKTCEGWVPDRRALLGLNYLDFRAKPPAMDSLSGGNGGGSPGGGGSGGFDPGSAASTGNAGMSGAGGGTIY